MVEDDMTCFMIVDEPDVSVNVSQDDNFASLQPGQTLTTVHLLRGQGMGGLPEDTSVGDVFRFLCKGIELDWWDCGDSSDHAETMVKLSCFIAGLVVGPKDNSGRPKLMVPASNSVEFTIV
ncbi:kinesin light [Phlyctema vagabunda]|uniref:Kinesin light n=1 Tax=Phlyctema vagabunda TaxID=108571 RepID=A0ABR4PW40_9HELO